MNSKSDSQLDSKIDSQLDSKSDSQMDSKSDSNFQMDGNEVIEAIKHVSSKKSTWSRVSLSDKLAYLLHMQQIVEPLVEKWAAEGSYVRKYDNVPQMKGFSYVLGAGCFGICLSSLIDTYVELIASGKPPKPVNIRQKENQNIVTTFPKTYLEQVFGGGLTVDLYLEPGKPIEQGKALLSSEPTKLCGVLGAGNYEAPIDILTKLFVENKVVIYKPHPVNHTATVPFFREIFHQLIANGFLEILTSPSVEVGQILVNHVEVDEILITGGAATYDRLVWGQTPTEQEANKKNGKKLLNKPVNAELGASTPYIIVPGPWTPLEITHHVELIVSGKLINSGAVCASPQILLVDKDWPQKDEFLKCLKECFQKVKQQSFYYPGTEERVTKFKQYCSENSIKVDVVSGNSSGPNDVNWIILYNIPEDSKVIKEECFGPVIAVFELDTKNNPAAFMKEVTHFCNTKPFGSLSCSVFIDPKTQASFSTDFETMISNLEWGVIAINELSMNALSYGSATWGAFPKHTPENIGSGMGHLMNTDLYSYVQKTVLRGVWNSPSHSKLPSPETTKILSRFTYFAIYPSWWRLLTLISASVLGI